MDDVVGRPEAPDQPVLSGPEDDEEVNDTETIALTDPVRTTILLSLPRGPLDKPSAVRPDESLTIDVGQTEQVLRQPAKHEVGAQNPRKRRATKRSRRELFMGATIAAAIAVVIAVLAVVAIAGAVGGVGIGIAIANVVS